MLRKNSSDKLDIAKINEGVKISVSVLRILLFMLGVALVYLVTLILSKWNILPIIFDVLKVISPLFIGIVVAWLLDPFVTKLNKRGVSRPLGVVFTYVLMIVIILLFFWLTIPSISSQVNDFVSSIPSFVSYLKDGIDGIFANLSNLSGYDLTSSKIEVYDFINNMASSLTVDLPNLIMSVLSSIINGGINLVFGLIIGFYMLFDFGSIRKHFISLIPTSKKKDVNVLLDKLNGNLRSYVHGTLLIMLILFTFQTLGLTIAGMTSPLVFGLFCAITNVIPYFGPYIGGVPTVLVAFSISPMVGILSLISVLISQVLESYFLQPIVMSKSMKLHPVTIMIGLLLFGHFFGIIGMIIATPVISVIKTVWVHYNEKYDLLEKITN